MVTGKMFLRAFAAEWRLRCLNDGRVCMETHDRFQKRQWNAFLLEQGGVFDRVCNVLVADGLRLTYGPEWRRFDAAYLWDGRPIVLIENEMDQPEREMRKLVDARAPLKVLCIYDWGGPAKIERPKRAAWLPDRISTFARLIQESQACNPDVHREEFLALVGSKDERGAVLSWTWFDCPGLEGRSLEEIPLG